MPPRSRLALARLAAAATLALAVAAPGIAQARSTDDDPPAVPIYALTTSDRLLTLSADDPVDVLDSEKIRGLRNQEWLIGIDVRPADGRLYVVGKLGKSGRLYTIDPVSAQATFVADLRQASDGQPVVLDGTEFGFDFNPAADALRIVSNTGQNLRALPTDRIVAGVQRFTGDTFVDGSLSRSPIGALPRPIATGITGAAYSNNDNDPATGTTLYDIDANRDELLIQAPPNDGTVTRVGDLGRGTRPLVGFDIKTTSSGDTAYASLARGFAFLNLTNLVIVDLATGDVTDLGRIGTLRSIRDIAAG